MTHHGLFLHLMFVWFRISDWFFIPTDTFSSLSLFFFVWKCWFLTFHPFNLVWLNINYFWLFVHLVSFTFLVFNDRFSSILYLCFCRLKFESGNFWTFDGGPSYLFCLCRLKVGISESLSIIFISLNFLVYNE